MLAAAAWTEGQSQGKDAGASWVVILDVFGFGNPMICVPMHVLQSCVKPFGKGLLWGQAWAPSKKAAVVTGLWWVRPSRLGVLGSILLLDARAYVLVCLRFW